MITDEDGALLRRAPDGELVPDLDPEAAHDCRGGWLGDDDAPVPCPVCRPHLAGRTPRRHAPCKPRSAR